MEFEQLKRVRTRYLFIHLIIYLYRNIKKTDTKKINAQKAGHQKYIDRGQLKRLDRLALEVPFRQGLNVKQSVADLISCIALDDSL